MAPLVPEDVDLDVYHVPHERMKELMNGSLDLMTRTNFNNVHHLRSLLLDLSNTFKLLKAHEQIENRVIMTRLKDKLRALSITNTAVCDCHSDDRLVQMLNMFKTMYKGTKRNKANINRYNVEVKLRQALDDFTKTFTPHMNEEEEIFQPLLEKHFSREELSEIRETVIQQHLIRLDQADETKLVLDRLTSESCSSSEDDYKNYKTKTETKSLSENLSLVDAYCDVTESSVHVNDLPDEVMVKVMSNLSPRDLSNTSRVSHRWNSLAKDGRLWSQLSPIHWARGDWQFRPNYDLDPLTPTRGHPDPDMDEDTDIDESSLCVDVQSHDQKLREGRILSHMVGGLCTGVGWAITKINLSRSLVLSAAMLCRVLTLCLNLEHLNVSYTRISDSAFKCLKYRECCRRLTHLDLSGCVKVTSLTLKYIAYIASPWQRNSDVTNLHDTLNCKNRDVTSLCKNCPQRKTCENYLKNWTNFENLDKNGTCGSKMPCSRKNCNDCAVIKQSFKQDDGYTNFTDKSGFNTRINSPISQHGSRSDYLTDRMTYIRENLGSNFAQNAQNSGAKFTQNVACSRGVFDNTNKNFRREIKCSRSVDDLVGKFRQAMNYPTELCCRNKTGCTNLNYTDELSVSKGEKTGARNDFASETRLKLKYLSLSGCYKIDDEGLESLTEVGGLPSITHLDLSGCPNLTPPPLNALVSLCPTLDLSDLYYCDNITDTPYDGLASGCQNVGCDELQCCRSGLD